MVFGEETLHFRHEFIGFFLVQLAAAGTGKSGVDSFHETIAADEERCGPSVPIERLCQLLLGRAGLAAQENRVLDAVLLDERLQASRVAELLGLFK